MSPPADRRPDAHPRQRDPRDRSRGLWLLLGFYAATLLAAAWVTPPVYWWIHGWAVGGESDLAVYLADKELPRYFDRIRWLFVLAGLPWLCRATGLTSAGALGLRSGSAERRRLVVWLAVGFAMVAGIAGGQLASGSAGLRAGLTAGTIVVGLLVGLVAAALIAFFEELVFRGVVFQLAHRTLPAWGSVPVAAAIFALLHFQRVPSDAWPDGTPVTWTSGFTVAWESLAAIPRTVEATTGAALLLAGAILCLLFLRHGSLLPPIGLHAGWVWSAHLHRRLLQVPEGADTAFWGGRHLIDGALPLALLVLLLVGMLLAFRYSAATMAARGH